MNEQLSMFEQKTKHQKVVNVASVPQRSPFRYPGGKTWLIPVVRRWLKQSTKPKVLVEPFAGGGIVSLTAAFENLAEKIVMVELDPEIASVWKVIIHGDCEWLASMIFNFELTVENANKFLSKENPSLKEQAFRTILKNRIHHGGIITKGSGLIKNGEKGKGIISRWYPKTLRDRINAISHVREKIDFSNENAFVEIDRILNQRQTFTFLDPPYTKAGKRLYTYFDIDHDRLFQLTSKLKGSYMLTYDDTDEIRNLIDKYQLDFRKIPMKTTHHRQKNEIIISDNFNWW